MNPQTISIPADIDAEKQVIGSLLLRPDLFPRVNGIIKADDLYLESHRLIYNAIQDLFHGDFDGEIDSVSVIHYLTDRSLVNDAGGSPYIMSLSEDVVSPSNAASISRRLKSVSIRRHLIKVAQNIIKDANDVTDDEGSFLRSIEERVLKITNSDVTPGIQSVQEIKEEFITHLTGLLQSRGKIQGTSTDFSKLDQLTSGLKGGELIVLAARPGIGKTTLALNIASNVATIDKKAVLVYSLEMGNHELMMRLVCAQAQFSHSELKKGKVEKSRNDDITAAISLICSSPIYIDDSGDLTIWDCLSRTRKFKVEMDQKAQQVGLIIVDYLQLMTDPDARKMGRQQEIATISRSLKQLAKAVDVPILALSQMNRSVEQRRGDYARPQLSDLRESGAIEQDADIVMFIHKDTNPDPNDTEAIEKQGKVEIILAKHRSGPTGHFDLAFRPEINRFDNLDEETDFY